MSKRSDPEHPELTHPSTKRAKKIDQDLPYDNLLAKLDGQGSKNDVSKIAHWFRRGLRIHDNMGASRCIRTGKGSTKAINLLLYKPQLGARDLAYYWNTDLNLPDWPVAKYISLRLFFFSRYLEILRSTNPEIFLTRSGG